VRRAAFLSLFLTLPLTACRMPQLPPPPQTVPEASGHLHTSSHAEVIAFLDAVDAAADPRVQRRVFGVTPEGRELPLLVIADPPVRSPEEARASGLPVVLVMANIHAGEVEGKEACLQLLREVVWDETAPWPLAGVVTLIAPIYNADGNDAFGPGQRPLQNGPAPVGRRETAKGLDLNRDYLKLENVEARHLVRLIAEWDPHVVVDLHTTNGSAHGYELTYAPPLTPSAHPELLRTLAADWLPLLRARMRERHGFETFDYGNFLTERGAFQDEPDRVTGWQTFDHRPRFGNNYAGLRNRLGILSEAYAYADFPVRIAATRAFVVEILQLVAERGAQVPALCQRLDVETAEAAAAGRLEQALGAKAVPRGAPEELLLRGFELVTDPASGEKRRVAAGPLTRIEVPCSVVFAATATRSAARAYLLPPGRVDLLELLDAHGVRYEILTEARPELVRIWTVAATSQASRPFQGHRQRTTSWETADAERLLQPGSVRVSTAQPLGRLVFELLDPEAEDGLFAWNFFDESIAAGTGSAAPVWGLFRPE